MTKQGLNSGSAFDWGCRLLTVGCLAFCYLLAFGGHSIGRVLSLESAMQEKSAETFRRAERNRQLIAQLDGLKHDERVLEEKARSVLDLVRPDEVVFIVRGKNTAGSGLAPTVKNTQGPSGCETTLGQPPCN